MHVHRTTPQVFTVSELNQQVRELLETGFPPVWISGEISNLRKHTSGHFYFSLKDQTAQVRCCMFRGRNRFINFNLQDGQHVVVQAKISLYEERGEYQLVVEQIEEAGEGALRRAFEQLKQKLAAEGLFEPQRKKEIPAFPKTIGVITSPTGAAIRDILQVLKRRFSYGAVIIYPAQVQGTDAARQVANAIILANKRQECDVLIIARGGGSLEDLWPFNEENVARAIYASEIPTVSGVGHEIDFTICDFVVDQRAPTPSAAAELVTPDLSALQHKLMQFNSRLKHFALIEIKNLNKHLLNLSKRLQHPSRKLQDYAQRLDFFEQRLQTAMQHQLLKSQQQFANVTRALDTVSPLNTLQRGYAIVTKQEKILRDITEVRIGEEIQAQIANGKLSCLVQKIN